MPTDNPKISLYVPQQIYDRFMEYKKRSGLSMSQAGTVLLAEYFGIEETIKEITEGTTVGGITLARVENIEKDVQDIKRCINELVDFKKTASSLLNKIESNYIVNKRDDSESVETLEDNISGLLKLTSPDEFLKIESTILAERFGLMRAASVNNASNDKNKSFADWSRNKDPDGIAWEKIRIDRNVYFKPVSDTPSELLSKLKEWLERDVKSEGTFA